MVLNDSDNDDYDMDERRKKSQRPSNFFVSSVRRNVAAVTATSQPAVDTAGEYRSLLLQPPGRGGSGSSGNPSLQTSGGGGGLGGGGASTASTAAASIMTPGSSQLTKMMKSFEIFQTKYYHHGHHHSHLGHHHHNSGKSKMYSVTMPKKTLLSVAAVFLILPLTLFFWKETHLHTRHPTDTEGHDHHATHHLRGHNAARHRHDPHPTWMEEAADPFDATTRTSSNATTTSGSGSTADAKDKNPNATTTITATGNTTSATGLDTSLFFLPQQKESSRDTNLKDGTIIQNSHNNNNNNNKKQKQQHSQQQQQQQQQQQNHQEREQDNDDQNPPLPVFPNEPELSNAQELLAGHAVVDRLSSGGGDANPTDTQDEVGEEEEEDENSIAADVQQALEEDHDEER